MSVDVTTYLPNARDYPAILRRRLGQFHVDHLDVIGKVEHLDGRLLGFFCSSQCPGSVILDTFDLARELRQSNVTVVGGFQSPMEKEFLELLLRGPHPIVICPGRGIRKMRIPKAWRDALDAGRLTILSPFGETQRRVTSELAFQRNRLVAELADEVFIAHAATGSKTETLCRDVLKQKKPVLTIDRPENQGLIESGVEPLRPREVGNRWASHATSDRKHRRGKR